MIIKVNLTADGRITSYATIGDIEGSQTITIPDDTDLAILSHARWDGEKVVELPVKPESRLDSADTVPTLQQQVADLQAQLAALIIGMKK